MCVYIWYIYVYITYIYIYILHIYRPWYLWKKTMWVGAISFMFSQSCSQLITVNLQYDSIKITEQCSGINCMNSIRIQGWSDPHYVTFWVNTYSARYSYSVKTREKIRTKEILWTRALLTQWSGYVVHEIKFVFVSTLRDKFISLV